MPPSIGNHLLFFPRLDLTSSVNESMTVRLPTLSPSFNARGFPLSLQRLTRNLDCGFSPREMLIRSAPPSTTPPSLALFANKGVVPPRARRTIRVGSQRSFVIGTYWQSLDGVNIPRARGVAIIAQTSMRRHRLRGLESCALPPYSSRRHIDRRLLTGSEMGRKDLPWSTWAKHRERLVHCSATRKIWNERST